MPTEKKYRNKCIVRSCHDLITIRIREYKENMTVNNNMQIDKKPANDIVRQRRSIWKQNEILLIASIHPSNEIIIQISFWNKLNRTNFSSVCQSNFCILWKFFTFFWFVFDNVPTCIKRILLLHTASNNLQAFVGVTKYFLHWKEKSFYAISNQNARLVCVCVSRKCFNALWIYMNICF